MTTLSNDDQTSATSSGMTFDDIRRYLATREIEDPSIGGATLSTLRSQIQSNETEYERVKSHLQRKRAREKQDEVRQLANKQRQAREEKTRQTAALEELRRLQIEAKQVSKNPNAHTRQKQASKKTRARHAPLPPPPHSQKSIPLTHKNNDHARDRKKSRAVWNENVCCDN